MLDKKHEDRDNTNNPCNHMRFKNFFLTLIAAAIPVAFSIVVFENTQHGKKSLLSPRNEYKKFDKNKRNIKSVKIQEKIESFSNYLSETPESNFEDVEITYQENSLPDNPSNLNESPIAISKPSNSNIDFRLNSPEISKNLLVNNGIDNSQNALFSESQVSIETQVINDAPETVLSQQILNETEPQLQIAKEKDLQQQQRFALVQQQKEQQQRVAKEENEKRIQQDLLSKTQLEEAKQLLAKEKDLQQQQRIALLQQQKEQKEQIAKEKDLQQQQRIALIQQQKEQQQRVAKEENKKRIQQDLLPKSQNKQLPVALIQQSNLSNSNLSIDNNPSIQLNPSYDNSYITRESRLTPSVQLASLKLERLIDNLYDKNLSRNKTLIRELPIKSNFSYDIEIVNNKYKEIRKLDLLLAANPNNASIYYQRGNAYYNISTYDNAISDYSRVLEIQPNNFSALLNRGALKRKNGDIDGALKDYNLAISISPNDSDAYRNRGIARETIGDLEGAQLDWIQASRLGDNEAQRWVVPLSSKPIEDISLLSLVRMHSTPLPMGLEPSNIQQNIQNNPKQINTKLLVAIKSDPSNPLLLYRRGNEFIRIGRYDLAIIDFSDVLKRAANNTKALFNRAVAKRQIGDLNGALLDYNKVIQISPNDHEAYRNRGILFQILGSISSACADWGIAFAYGNQDVKPWIDKECR